MATLAKDAVRTYELGDINEIPVVAADIIYEGAAVGDNGSGYGRPLVAGDPFRGFAQRQVDNSAGAAGDKDVKLISRGKIQLSIGGLAITDVGKDVYASDDATFTLTKGSNTRIGSVHRYVSSGVGIVKFEAAKGEETELTDNTGGVVADTIANTVGVDVADAGPAQVVLVSEFENAVASLAAKVNYLLGRMGS
jgi:hypothetical protein